MPLISILNIKESEYRERFAGIQIAASWVSFPAIQRNAAVALGNSRDGRAVEALSKALRSNPSELVRMHAAWALGKIGNARAASALSEQLESGLSGRLRQEAARALEAIS